MEIKNVNARMQWMDALRGIAIILVIVFHAVSLADMEDIGVASWVIQLNYFFLPYRMPTLMFLSGLLLTGSLKKSRYSFYEGKIRLLIWPYFIWTFVYILAIGTGYPIYHPAAWLPQGKHLWFLAYITAYYFCAPLMKRLPAWFSPIFLIVASIVVDSGFLYFAAFFFLGNAASVYRDIFERALGSRWMLVAGTLALGFGVFSIFVDVEHKGQYALFSLAGIFSAIWICRRAESLSFNKPLRYLGRKSLVFYVSHVPIMAVCIDIGRSIGIASPIVLILSCIAISVIAGYLLTLVASTKAGRWLFEMPRIDSLFRRRDAASAGLR